MRRISFLFAVVMLLSLPVAAEAAPPEQFTFEGETANASWVQEGEEEFVFSDVFLSVGTFTFGGDEFEVAFLDFFSFRAGPDGFTDIFGFAELEPDQFELEAQGAAFSAAVTAELEVEVTTCAFEDEQETCESSGPFFVTLQVDWDDAVGRIYPSSFSGRSVSPFGFDVFKARSLARFTSATGSLTGDLEIELGETDQASIGRETQSERFRFDME